MKVKTISYSESKESVTAFGLKSWKKLGMEAEVEEGDILQTSVAVLKEYVKGMIMDESEVSETATWLTNEPPYSQSPIPETNIQREKVEIAIENCSSIQQLEQLADKALIHKLVKEYNEKKKQLQS